MKRHVFCFLALMLVVVFIAGYAFAGDKLGYVDLTRIFSEYGKTKEYDKILNDKQKAYEGERDKKVSDLKQLQDKINLLSDKEKETKRPDMESKIKTLQDFDRQKQTDLRKEQDDRMKEILKDIEDTVKQLAEKEGFTLVFNDRVLVYQSKSLDVTDKIIDSLNKNYGKK